jgi:hypothetical protein
MVEKSFSSRNEQSGMKEGTEDFSKRIEQREISEMRHLSRPLGVQRNGRITSKRWKGVPLG